MPLWLIIVAVLAIGATIGVLVYFFMTIKGSRIARPVRENDTKSILREQGDERMIDSDDAEFAESVSIAGPLVAVSGTATTNVYKVGEDEPVKSFSAPSNMVLLSFDGSVLFSVDRDEPNVIHIRSKASNYQSLTMNSPVLAWARHPTSSKWFAVATQDGVRTFFGCACNGGYKRMAFHQVPINHRPGLVWSENEGVLLSVSGSVLMMDPEDLSIKHQIDGEEDGFGTSVAEAGGRILVGAPQSNIVFEYAKMGSGTWDRVRSFTSQIEEFLGYTLHAVGSDVIISTARPRSGTKIWYYADLATGEKYGVETHATPGTHFYVVAASPDIIATRRADEERSILHLKFRQK